MLGASEALGDHLVRHPARLARAGHLRVHRPAPRGGRLRDALHRAGAAARAEASADALRIAYRRCLLSIAARDVCGTTDLTETAAELADLATATLRAALAIADGGGAGRRRRVAGSR